MLLQVDNGLVAKSIMENQHSTGDNQGVITRSPPITTIPFLEGHGLGHQ